MRRATFEALLSRHGPALARIGAGYARTAGERDDLQQEMALALWRAWPSFRGECAEQTFVFRVAHNVCLSHAWRRRKEGTREDVAAAEAAHDPAPGPEALTHAGQRRTLLQNALRTLPERHREVLLLALEELSHDEIAAVVGITPNNVAVRLSRAREALRRALGVER